MSSNGDVLLDVSKIRLALGGTPILEDVSFQVFDRVRVGEVTGQVVALLGPSGVGKTRLMRIIAGLDEADAGTIRGQEGAKLVSGEVGYVFQHYPLLQHRTVESNLRLAGQIAGMSEAETDTRAKQLMEIFNLSERATFFPAQISGGQRQRVAIAQQIMRPRQLLLMDEPFSGLDPAALGNVMSLVKEVAHLDELNTILLVTHDIRAAMAVSDTLHMLGRFRGDDEKIVPGARIRETYDMVERGLAWKRGVEALPEFTALEREISAKFHDL